MYLTTIKFKRALEWFAQTSYDYMLLYASGATKLDYDMVDYFLEYKELIDRQTGEMVCFLHFMESSDSYRYGSRTIIQVEHNNNTVVDFMLYHISTEEARNLTKRDLYRSVGLKATYQTTDDICSFFDISRHELPAFILVHKTPNAFSIESFKEQYSIFSIKSKDDFDSLLMPIKIANDFKMDLQLTKHKLFLTQSEQTYGEVLKDIELKRKSIESLESGKNDDLIENIQRIMTEINDSLCEYDTGFRFTTIEPPKTVKKLLTEAGIIKGYMEKHNDLYFRYKALYYKIMKWDNNKEKNIVKLQKEVSEKEALLLLSQTRESRIKELTETIDYIIELYKKKFEEVLLMEDASPLVYSIINNSSTLPMILESTIKIYMCKEKLFKSIADDIRNKVKKMQFDVFISCKSEDYEQGEAVYAFLKNKGYKPFIASKSLRDIGGDRFSLVISEIIDVCTHMIVIATQPLYVETSYVKSEWSMFCNEMKTGRKKGKLLTILKDPTQGPELPIDLRIREVLSISDYKASICNYLN